MTAVTYVINGVEYVNITIGSIFIMMPWYMIFALIIIALTAVFVVALKD